MAVALEIALWDGAARSTSGSAADSSLWSKAARRTRFPVGPGPRHLALDGNAVVGLDYIAPRRPKFAAP